MSPAKWHADGPFVCDERGRAIRVWGNEDAKLVAQAPDMADLLLEQWNIERCEDEACEEHGTLTRILRAAGRLP